MEKLKNKNTVILIISALLIIIALIVAVSAISGNNKKKKAEIDQSIAQSESIAQSLSELANQQTEPNVTSKSFNFDVGTYKIATKNDPLGLRLEPNTSSDRLIYIPKGHEVKVLAVWQDWGYVVYEKTGGWLSMNYLEAVSTGSATTTTTAAAAQ